MKTLFTVFTLTAGATAWAAANPPLNVNVTNTPLPVSVTNATSNQSVTVTNSATNPVNTVEVGAFPRTAVRIRLGVNGADYVVPDGFRLVVETASLHVECPIADTLVAGQLQLGHMTAPGSFEFSQLDMALQSQGSVANHSHFTATQSVRFSLDPGDRLGANGFCSPDTSDSTGKALVLGYLISVNSPSLAP